ncbi:MAG TPA: tetratricopeptide repeat protein, partial [Kofleriaceae bacterium]
MLAMMRSLAFATVLGVVRAAAAEPADTGEASASFQRGRDLAKLGRFDEACAEFENSYELDPALGTAVNLADCLEHQGKLYRAWELFDRVARDSQNVQSRARLARRRAAALESRFARVIVTIREPSTPGLALRIGDRQVAPAAEVRELIEPRDVEVVATAPGRPAFRTTLHAARGQVAQVDVPAFADPPHEVSAGVPADAPVTTRRRRSRVYLAGGLGGAGVIGLGISLDLAITARHRYNAAIDGVCRQAAGGTACLEQVDSAGHRADLATGFVLGGAALVGAAVAVYMFAPREPVQVAPLVADRALGLGVAGRF